MTTAEASKVATRQIIVPIGRDMPWLEARKAVKDKDGLPSHVLHDDILVRSDTWKKIIAENPGYYGAWAREVYVYPEKNGAFQKGRDVVDAFKDENGRQWVYPGSLIPVEAFEMRTPSLFVDPGADLKSIEVNDKRVVIAGPISVTVVNPSIQISGQVGKVDESTRIPLYVDEALRNNLTEEKKRWLWRIDGAGVRPLARVFYDDRYGRRLVYAVNRPDDWLGVGWVSLSDEPEQIKQAVMQVPSSFILTLRRDAKAAEPILKNLRPIMRTEDFDILERVVSGAKTLEIKE